MNSLVMPHFFVWIKEVLGLVGVCIIVVGAIVSAHAAWRVLISHEKALVLNDIRQVFACYIVLGLEFLLASDIVMTIMAPDYYTLGILGGLVIIRTVMTVSLDKDIKG